MKHVAVLLASVLLAASAALGMSAIKPGKVDAASTTVRACTGGAITLKTIEKRMLELHNRARANHGLPRLCVHPKLQKAARAHSADMIQRDYFSHNTKGRNEGECERIRRFGYRWRNCGENIAWGSGSAGAPLEIFRVDNPNISGPDNWMDSRDHRSNILNRRFR